MAPKKRQCSKGVSCSSTCIQKGKKCRRELDKKTGASLSSVRSQVQKAVSETPDYESWTPIAQGFHGKIAINPEKTRVVKTLLKGEDGRWGEFGPHEVELATRMGELGHSPKIRSSGEKHIEMDLAKGSPLWKSYTRGEGEPVMNTAQARKAGYAFRDLHKMGFAHGDAHALQFLVDGNNVKLVDFGLSVPVSRQPARVMQDLSKIAKLVGWDNPELANDLFFGTVNKHLEEYKALGNSTSKAAKAKRVKIAESYLNDLLKLEQ